MQVAALQQFLRSLVPALEAAGDGKAAARWLDEAARGLDPFRSLGVAEFAAFLARADEYQRTGSVRVPGPADLRAESLSAALARLAAARDRPATELTGAQADVARSLEAVAREAGLTGALLPDPLWAARTRIAPHLKAIRELAGRIASPADYATIEPDRARLEGVLDFDAMKAVGAEFGVKVTAATKPAKLLGDVLTKLSGHAPPKAKPASRAKASPVPADPAVVEEHAGRLKNLVTRSADPDAVSEAEVEAELKQLKGLAPPVLVEVATRAGVEGAKPSDSKKATLERIRIRLTAARRARERAEV
jgi:hypothetical protein